MDTGAAEEADQGFEKAIRRHWYSRFIPDPKPSWEGTRFVFLRWLGFIYFIAFFSLYNQVLPLLGAKGLLPIDLFLRHAGKQLGTGALGFYRFPTLFWMGHSDSVLLASAGLGTGLSLLLMLGVSNALLLFALWFLYLSFVQVGQIFYGYGWEVLLLETGFLSIFLCSLKGFWPTRLNSPTPVTLVWLFRWLSFRVWFGAGLIKVRGDECWRDFTCLQYHYETQPNPNPLSYWLHQAPPWFHTLGVLVNHIVELIVPFMVFGPRPLRHIAGLCFIGFQTFLIFSGNLSFLNWLTIGVAFFCFDDSAYARILPKRFLKAIQQRVQGFQPSRIRSWGFYALALLVGVLSAGPVLNMISPAQAMNASFDRLHLVNTYGAFGSVGKTRYEIVIEGTQSQHLDEMTAWREYSFPCKPGWLDRRPCIISPYHYRLDWQMWFAAMSRVEREPWFVHLVYKLLKGDSDVRALFTEDIWKGGKPYWIRAQLYRYEFDVPVPGARDEGEHGWWKRWPVGMYLRPVRADDEELLSYLRAYGLVEGGR